MSFETMLRTGRKLAEVGGYVATGLAAYVAVGLPLPATKAYVNEQILIVQKDVKDVKTAVLEGQRKTIRADRNALRSQKEALARSLTTTEDILARSELTRRLAEIDDELVRLADDDTEVRRKLQDSK